MTAPSQPYRASDATRMASACPACGQRRSIAPDRRFSAGLLSCSSCGLAWAPETAGDGNDALYAEGFYVDQPARFSRVVRELHRLNSEMRLRELRGMRPGRLLDVGAGKGHFLAAARQQGWEVVGVELSESAARRARDAYGLEIAVGDVMQLEVGGLFDAITLWHVLEHVPDPGALLSRLAPLLAERGRLVISVPNTRSLQARMFGRYWFHIDREHHLYHFTPQALRAMLSRHGFVSEHIGFFYPEMEIVGVVQSTLNAAGFERDQLYRFIKRDPTADRPWSAATALGLAAVVAPAAAAAALTMPLLGVGASMQFRARRSTGPAASTATFGSHAG